MRRLCVKARARGTNLLCQIYSRSFAEGNLEHQIRCRAAGQSPAYRVLLCKTRDYYFLAQQICSRRLSGRNLARQICSRSFAGGYLAYKIHCRCLSRRNFAQQIPSHCLAGSRRRPRTALSRLARRNFRRLIRPRRFAKTNFKRFMRSVDCRGRISASLCVPVNFLSYFLKIVKTQSQFPLRAFIQKTN